MGRAPAELRALGPVAAFTVLGPGLGAAVLAGTSGVWLPPLEALGRGAIPWVLLATVLLAGASLAPTHASSLVAGLLFGAVEGAVVALCGVAGAAVVGFVILRKIVGERFVQSLAARPRAQSVHQELLQRGAIRAVGVIALVRLSPVMPFAATNLVMAACGVRLPVFLVGSVLGIAPRVIAVSAAGAGAAQLDWSRGGDVGLAVVGGVATVAALAVIGWLGRRGLARAEAAAREAGR